MPVLDIPQRQCLVDFYEEDLPWHHRVLLVKGEGLHWIWLTPDGEVQRADLGQHRVVPLRRGAAAYPVHCADEGVYGFDPLPAADLEGYVADAKALGAILGFPGLVDDVAAPLAARFYVNDPLSPDYGFEVPPDAVVNPDVFIRRGAVALVEVNARWCSAVASEPPMARPATSGSLATFGTTTTFATSLSGRR